MAKKKRKSSLEKLLESDDNKTYETTIEDAERWFRILNSELFNGSLRELDEIDIRWRRGTHAYYYFIYEADPKKPKYEYAKLCLNKRYKSKQFFVEVLAHELVHHYQSTYGEPDDDEDGHGASFMKWSDVFRKKGLRLQKAYETDED